MAKLLELFFNQVLIILVLIFQNDWSKFLKFRMVLLQMI